MKNVRKVLLAALVTVAFGMLTGCGDDSPSAPAPTTKSVDATVVAAPPGSPAGSVATAASVPAIASNGAGTTIPANTVITPEGGSLAAGTIKVSIVTPPAGGTAGLKPKPGFVLAGAAGGVDISIPGITGFTVPAPGLDVQIPVTSCTAASMPVTVVRASGEVYDTTGTCSSNMVTVKGVTKFSSFIAGARWATGS